MTPIQIALIAIVKASHAVQEARDALVSAGFAEAAAMFDHAGTQIFFGMGKVVAAEAERRAAAGATS